MNPPTGDRGDHANGSPAPMIPPRPTLAAISPYVPGGRPTTGGTPLKLASNENPFGPSPRAIEAAHAAVAEMERYPDPVSRDLRERLGEHLGVHPDWILAGSGSDEILELIAHAYFDHTRRVVIPEPPFAVHRIVAQAAGSELISVPLKDHVHDLTAMAAAARPHGCVIVTNPHNPTGTIVEPDELRRFVDSVPANCLIILDEAYYEFVEPVHRLNGIELVFAHPNVIVTRTFSKAYGLAGCRVGYAIARPEILEPIHRIRPPFNVTSVSQAAATAALDDDAHLQRTINGTRQSMRILLEACERLGLRTVPSQANFVLIEERDDWAAQLAVEGVIVRPGRNLGCPGWARMSMGTPEQMLRVVELLERAVSSRPAVDPT